jgi:drug/metabolite transporter (DMT)-like permease
MNARRTSAAMGSAEWGMLLVLTVLWSATFPFAKIALAELPPLTLVLVRIAIAALALNMAVLGTGRPFAAIRQMWRRAWAAS